MYESFFGGVFILNKEEKKKLNSVLLWATSHNMVTCVWMLISSMKFFMDKVLHKEWKMWKVKIVFDNCFCKIFLPVFAMWGEEQKQDTSIHIGRGPFVLCSLRSCFVQRKKAVKITLKRIVKFACRYNFLYMFHDTIVESEISAMQRNWEWMKLKFL